MVQPSANLSNQTVNQPEPVLTSTQDPSCLMKLKVVGLFLGLLPALVLWTALTILLLPFKLWNVVQQCRGKEQIHFVNAMIREYFSLLSITFRYPCTKGYHYTPGTGTPILLVHGYLHNASGWYAMINRLKAENMGPIYAVDLGNGTIGGKLWSIRDYAKQIEAKRQEIATETGCPQLRIVGHSMGGLVAALCAKDAPQNTVTDVITLGTPFHGAPIAKHLAVGADGDELEPGSTLLAEIREGISAPHFCLRSIGSKWDLVVPNEAAYVKYVEGDDHYRSFDDLGHVSLQTADVVADQVCEWLKATKTV